MRTIFIVSIFLSLNLVVLSQSFLRLEDNCYSLTDEGLTHYRSTLSTSVDITGSVYWPEVYEQTHWVCNQVAASYYMMSYETNVLKGVSSQINDNLYSVYFPWNIGNGGYGWYGDHYLITMEMIKKLGVPKITENSGDVLRDMSLWPSGYEKYYDMMHNRISDYYVINTSTSDGILTLKSWIYDHCGEGPVGGTATFLSNIDVDGASSIAAGTPHAGYYLIHRCGNSALHARTIVGFDDDVCFDYNGDGQYTVNVDLNGDGVIDIRDSEKGAFKLAESYGPTWQGDGYCWIMYKAMADPYLGGGILNNNVNVIIPLLNYSPKLTVRLKLTHPTRDNVKVKLGVSSDVTADSYEYIQEFPILNYQGGDLYMQGGHTEADKTIEVGLDITSFEEYFNPDKCARFFLVVDEYDPNNLHEGRIDEFAIIDYSGAAPVEYKYPSSVEMNNNKVVEILNVCMTKVDAPKILTTSLPIFDKNSTLWCPLDFSGGTAPYRWEFVPTFEVSTFNRAFDNFAGTKLTPDTYFDGELLLDIPFSFPYHNSSTQKIKINTNGYIFPQSSTNDWTQFREHLITFFLNENMIAPLARFALVSDPSKSDGIWYKFVNDTVKIRWKECEQTVEAWTSIDFGCNLIRNGNIEFVYGTNYLRKKFSNIGGISYGYRIHNLIAYLDDVPAANTGILIKPHAKPAGLFINDHGIIYGDITQYNNYPVKIKVTDANGISHVRSYELNTGIERESPNLTNDFELYPNPVTNRVNVRLSNTLQDGDLEIKIYDNSGKIISEFSVYKQNEFSFDVSEYGRGIYHIIVSNKTAIKCDTFIKN